MNSKSFLPKLHIPIYPSNEVLEPPSKKYKKSPVSNGNINDKIIDLALYTLSLTREDYNSMHSNDLYNVFTTNDNSKILAIEILEYYKNN